MKKAIPKYIRLGFLCGLVIIALAAFLPYRNVQLLQNSERWTTHTMRVLQAADELRIAVTDAESGQRGYLLTQNPIYLEPYEIARKEISQQLISLSMLAADNPSQLENLNKLKELITQKFDELESTVALQNQGKREEALTLVTTNHGNSLMQEIREVTINFEKDEKELLNERVTTMRTHFQRTFYSVLFTTILTFLLFSSLYFFIIKSFKVKRTAELSLTQQSNLLTSVINSMSEGLFVIDAHGKCLAYNPMFTEIYGKSLPEFSLYEWETKYKISTVDGLAFAFENFPAVKVLKGEAQATAEMIIQPEHAKEPKIVRVNARPILNETGLIEGVVCISSDISDDKKAELRLRVTMEQAETANKAKSEFVANMSHEIRTPLNAILGMSHLLHKTELASAQKKYLDMIILSGKSLLNILNDILDFSKIEAGKMELCAIQFRLDDVIHSLATMMSMAALKKDIELIIDINRNVPALLTGDPHRLLQILVNLTSNAIKFTARGEVAVIIDCRAEIDNQVTMSFAVRDTGIGMTQEQQNKLFSAFTQADTSITRQFGGTGLGLTISNRLAELMGGHIELTSVPSQGSEFSLVLPFTRCDDIERRAFPRHPTYFNLLLIDNNESARHSIVNHINAWRWNVDIAISQDEGLDQLRKIAAKGERYDAVLLDWQTVSDMGIDAFSGVRVAASEKIPIILMVNMYAQEMLSENNLLDEKFSPFSLLLKPVISSSLFNTLNELLFHPSKTQEFLLDSDNFHKPLEKLRLLVVEDNEFNQIVARDILQQAGAIIDIASDGQKALDVLRNDTYTYDAILMDIQMPVMDGLTATTLIRKELHINTPIIAMTAGVTESERKLCLDCGMNDVIAKPIETEKLVSLVQLHTCKQAQAMQYQGMENITISPSVDGIFDVTNLLKIGEKTPGYRNKLAVMIKSLIDNTSNSFESAIISFKECEYSEVARILHTLRGSLGILGAAKFSEHALAVEQLIKDNASTIELESSFEKLQLELTATLVAAKKWMSENSNIE